MGFNRKYDMTDNPSGYKPDLLAADIISANPDWPWGDPNEAGIFSDPENKPARWVSINMPSSADEPGVREIVVTHNPSLMSFTEQYDALIKQARNYIRNNYPALLGKEPQEIFLLVQNQVDNIENLQDAKDLLREFVPFTMAILFWVVPQVREAQLEK